MPECRRPSTHRPASAPLLAPDLLFLSHGAAREYDFLIHRAASSRLSDNAMNQATANVSKEKLLDDFSEVVTEAEQLVKSVSGDKANALFARMEQNLRLAKERLGDLQEVTVKKTKAAAQATDNYVHENPWKAICVAAGLGILIGLLLNRR